MVTGLAGGASYENLNGRDGPARSYWNAFSFSLLVTALLIFIGGIIQAVYSSLTGGKQGAEGEMKL
jgi:hypothetical protein